MAFKAGFLAVAVASLTLLSGCNSGDTTKISTASGGPIAATVNGTSISQSRVDLMVKQGVAQGQADNADLRKEIVDHLAMQLLLSEEAIKKGLDKKPEVSDQLELVHQSILANAYVQDYLKSNPVSDEMLKAEYEKIKNSAGTEYKARHILVKSEAEAKDIIAKLKKNPKAFDALAKEKSMDPGSKDKGGELGWFDPRGMVPEFGTAVAQLEKGNFTQEPVKSQFGYHVILLEDSRPLTPPPFEQVKPMLQQQMVQANLGKLLDDMKAKAKIEITPPAAAKDAPQPGAQPDEAKKAAGDSH
jgi:peptidyl-prolyl cis-trans isomerase C